MARTPAAQDFTDVGTQNSYRAGPRTRGERQASIRARNDFTKRDAGVYGGVHAPSVEVIRRCIEAQECPWCGRSGFVRLSKHTHQLHGVSADDLRELADLPKSATTCGDGESRREIAMARGPSAWKPLIENRYEAKDGSAQAEAAERRRRDRERMGEATQKEAARARRVAREQRRAELYRQIHDAYITGEWTKTELEGKFGVSKPTVRRALAEHGIKPNNHYYDPGRNCTQCGVLFCSTAPGGERATCRTDQCLRSWQIANLPQNLSA